MDKPCLKPKDGWYHAVVNLEDSVAAAGSGTFALRGFYGIYLGYLGGPLGCFVFSLIGLKRILLWSLFQRF